MGRRGKTVSAGSPCLNIDLPCSCMHLARNPVLKETRINFSRLYVGNVPPSIDIERLRELFSAAGEVLSVQVIPFPASQSYAFVQMASPEAAQQAIQQYHNDALGGRQLIV